MAPVHEAIVYKLPSCEFLTWLLWTPGTCSWSQLSQAHLVYHSNSRSENSKMDATKKPLLIPPEFSNYAEKHGIFQIYEVSDSFPKITLFLRT